MANYMFGPVLAPPFIWGAPVRLTGLGGGPFKITVDAESISDASSSFSGRIEYVGEGGIHTSKEFLGPGTVSVITDSNSWQQPTLRFKSHSTGQIIQGSYSVVSREKRGGQHGRIEYPTFERLIGPMSWSNEDVLNAQGSDAYWNSSHPDHKSVQENVASWYQTRFD